MSNKHDFDLRTDDSHSPALEKEQDIFNQINLELNISALFGIGTASVSYKILPWTNNVVRNHGWLGYINILMVSLLRNYSRAFFGA